MRQRFYLLALAFAFGLASCTSKATLAPLPPQSPQYVRGSILWMHRVGTLTKAEMNAGLAGKAIAELGGPAQCNVSLYAIKYRTIGAQGEPADASAAFFVPGPGCGRHAYTLVGYAPGTNVVRAEKMTDPTKQNPQPTVIAAIYAAHGYAVAATDYLGLGYSSYPYQPYLVVSAEASAVIDSLRAARFAAQQLHVPLSGRVFLTGHSQGGQSSMAAQRAIESEARNEFDLIADAPSSGPYALTQTFVDGVTHPGQSASIFAAYALTAYQKTYDNVYARVNDAFQRPYSRWVENLLPVDTYAQAAELNGKTLPLQVGRLLQPSFVSEFVNQPNSGPRVDLALNDLLDGWTPIAPLDLCGGSRDPEVEFKNAQLAYRYFKHRGARVTLTDVNALIPKSIPITLYHDAVLVFCLTLNRVHDLDGKYARFRSH